MDNYDSEIGRVRHWGLLVGGTGGGTIDFGGGTKWGHRLGGGARHGTITGWMVAQELLSPKALLIEERESQGFGRNV